MDLDVHSAPIALPSSSSGTLQSIGASPLRADRLGLLAFGHPGHALESQADGGQEKWMR
jgi:hypothetical protein